MMGSHHQRLLEASAFSDREIGVYDEHGDSVSAVRPPQTPKNVEGDRPDFISSIPTRLMNRLRRPHHKSRSGCRNCKTRKVKVSRTDPRVLSVDARVLRHLEDIVRRGAPSVPSMSGVRHIMQLRVVHHQSSSEDPRLSTESRP